MGHRNESMTVTNGGDSETQNNVIMNDINDVNDGESQLQDGPDSGDREADSTISNKSSSTANYSKNQQYFFSPSHSQG